MQKDPRVYYHTPVLSPSILSPYVGLHLLRLPSLSFMRLPSSEIWNRAKTYNDNLCQFIGIRIMNCGRIVHFYDSFFTAINYQSYNKKRYLWIPPGTHKVMSKSRDQWGESYTAYSKQLYIQSEKKPNGYLGFQSLNRSKGPAARQGSVQRIKNKILS